MSQTTPATQTATMVKKAITTPLHSESLSIPKQHYSLWSRIRANLYGRGTLIAEAVIALTLLVAVFAIDILFLESHLHEDFLAALADTFKLLTLQNSLATQQDRLSEGLFVFNVLFSVLFIQSVLNTVRALISKRSPEVQQRGLAITRHKQVIVCGLGRIGLRVITRLVESGAQVVVIERNFQGELVPRALDMRVPVIVGEAQEADTLHKAGISRASAVIACIDGDLTNVEIALAARAENDDIRVVLRAFDEDFDRGLEHIFGAHTAFSASALAAPTFAAATLSRDIEHVLPLGNELLGVSQFTVANTAQGANTLQALEDHYRVRAIELHSQSGRNISYNPAHALSAGETVTMIGQIRALEALRGAGLTTESSSTYPVPLAPTPQCDRIIICGFGKVGYRVVRWLAQWQLPIVVIHRDDDDDDEHDIFTERIINVPGVQYIRGDARKASVLKNAGIDRALTIAAVTSDDLTNLQIGLEARRIQPDVHVVLRVFSDAFAEKLPYLFGIHTAYSTSELASATLAAAAVIGGISHAFPGPTGLYLLDEYTLAAGDPLVGKTIAGLHANQTHVIGLQRNGAATIFPAWDAVLNPGDNVAIVAPLAALRRLHNAQHHGK